MDASVHSSGVRVVDVRVLPARAAYLVPKGDPAAFLRAVEAASGRWGGATELILPVDGEALDPFDCHLTEIAVVDGLVDVGLADGVAATIGRLVGLPVVAVEHIDQVFPLFCTPSPLSVRAPEPIDGNPPVAAQEGSAVWMSTAAGAFDAETWDWLRDNAAPLHPHVRTPWGQDQLGLAQLDGSTWLHRTLHRFAETYGSQAGGNLPAVLWVTDGKSLDDCVDFWNLRALRPLAYGSMPMTLVPVDACENWTTFPQQLLGALGRADAPTPDLFITSLSVATERLRAIAQRLGLQPQEPEDKSIQIGTTFRDGGPRRQPPYQYRVLAHTHALALTYRRYGVFTQTDAHLSGGTANLRFESPVAIDNGLVLLRLGGALFEGVPRRPEVAELIASGSSWRENDLQLGRQTLPQYAIELAVPSLAACLDAILSRATQGYEPSEPGVLAQSLAAGGAAAVLPEPGVLTTIRQLATHRRGRLTRELAGLGLNAERADQLASLVEDWADNRARAYKAADDLPKQPGWNRRDVLERLVSLGWAERGAQLRCGRCKTKTFLPIDTIPARGAPTCPACAAAGRLTARPNSDPTMFYRLDGLIDTLVDRGVLPHLLAIAVIQRDYNHVWLRPGTFVKLENRSDPHEVDLLGLIDGKLAYGEVKAGGTWLTRTEIDDDIDICEKIGVDIYVLAALDDIPADVVQHARDLCERDSIALLTLTNLEPLSPAPA